ncbi:MAG: type II toxin-antitoxin system RelE/ParE family toxin [Candidatus Thermoplasmatota archaeon]
MDAHLEKLAQEPFRPRPGMDIKKLKDVDGDGLYRLRVGEHRAIYAVVSVDRVVTVLVVDDREAGYSRMIQRAMARMRD